MKASAFKTGLLNGTSIPLGKRVRATIVGVESTALDGETKESLLVKTDYEGGKDFACNQDRLDTLITGISDETSDWAGREILMWQDKARFKGKHVASLKISVVPLNGRTPR